jgi:hypothetical protein
MIVWDLNSTRYLIALKSNFDNEENCDELDTWMGSPPAWRRVEKLFGTDLVFSFGEISGLFSGQVNIKVLGAHGFSLHPVEELNGKIVTHIDTERK